MQKMKCHVYIILYILIFILIKNIHKEIRYDTILEIDREILFQWEGNISMEWKLG